MRTKRALSLLLLFAVATGVANCSSKVAVVCDKLDGCGLMKRDYDECVDVVETAFADDRIDDKELSKCVDCLSFNFCSAIEDGACGDLDYDGKGEPGECGEIVRQIREFYGGDG